VASRVESESRTRVDGEWAAPCGDEELMPQEAKFARNSPSAARAGQRKRARSSVAREVFSGEDFWRVGFCQVIVATMTGGGQAASARHLD